MLRNFGQSSVADGAGISVIVQQTPRGVQAVEVISIDPPPGGAFPLGEEETQATPEELAAKLQMPLEKVRKVMKIAKEPISLETPIGDEEDSQLGDFIEDKNAILPLDSAIQENLKETTTRVLASLTPREERVLRRTHPVR